MPRQPKEIRVVHASADYYEALFRARFVKVMKKLQSTVSINALALSMGNVRQAQSIVTRAEILKALMPLKKILADSFMKGGRIGADHVKETLK